MKWIIIIILSFAIPTSLFVLVKEFCVDQINTIKKDEYSRGFYNCLAIVVERSKVEKYNVLPEWDECERSFERKEDLYNHWKNTYLFNKK